MTTPLRLPLLVCVLALVGCNTPKEIDGYKVIGSRLIDGKIVYLVETPEGVMQRVAKQMEEDTKDFVIKPVKAPPKPAESTEAAQ